MPNSSALKKVTPLSKPVKVSVAVPGSKSIANRALLCAALTKGTSTIHNLPKSEDVLMMLRALEQLGVRIIQKGTSVKITGRPDGFVTPKKPINIGNAGTAARFLLPHLPVGTVLTGNAYMQKRPIQPLLDAMKQIGITTDCPTGCPPVRIIERNVNRNTNVSVDGSISSQYVSALMMLGVPVRRVGKRVSEPYIVMTHHVMNVFTRATNYSIPPDASSATYWWALAAITNSIIGTPGIAANDSTQADVAMLRILERMGCEVKNDVAGITVIGPRSLQPITVDMGNCPDAVLSVAIIAACADGVTTLSNIAHLQAKETARLTLLRENLHRVGIKTELTNDTIVIHGNPQALQPAVITTEHDHRFAMAFAILGQRVAGMYIEHPKCVKKSYPTFWQDLQQVQRTAKRQQIVFIGMRGTGKTTIGAHWANHYKAKFVDTDAVVEHNLGMSIADYVTARGWKAFRTQERKVMKQVLAKPGSIIATGGGAILHPTTQRELAKHYVIFIYTPISELKKRLRAEVQLTKQLQRPALTTFGAKELDAVWRERKDLYNSLADYVIDSRKLNA